MPAKPPQPASYPKRGGALVWTSPSPRCFPVSAADRLSRPAIQAYAARAGQSVEEYLQQMGPPVTPEIAGTALVELVQTDAAEVARAYLLTGAGLQKLP